MTNYIIDFVIKLALILLLSLLPSLVYLLIFRRAKEHWQMRLRRAQVFTAYHDREQVNYDSYDYPSSSLASNNYPAARLRDHRRPVTKYFIGDTSCVNNANSPYIRCAINPNGPCEGCVHYEQRFNSDIDRQ